MKKLVIIGASAMGRETCEYARECGMSVKGFLDSRFAILDDFTDYPPILGSVETWRPSNDEVYVCACGEPKIKRKYVSLLPNVKWATVIHPSAYVGKNVRIGCGGIICPNVSITNEVIIGSHVIVNLNVSISHDSSVGDFSTLCPGSHIAGRVVIGRSVFIGTGANLIPDVSLGDNMVVAAGATVIGSFKSGRVMGLPARLK